MTDRNMTFLVACLMILSTAMMFVGPTSGSDVSGPISTNTAWTLAMSPINLTRNVTVDVGSNLTIDAGVVVRFAEHTCIFVDGNLSIEGNDSAPVMFISNATTPMRGDHFGVIVNSTGTVHASWLNISNVSTAVVSNGSAMVSLDSFTAYNCTLAVNVTHKGYAEIIDSDAGMNITAPNGSCYIKNTIRVRTLFENNMTPIEGVDIQALDSTGIIYSSPGYASGTDPATEINGYSAGIIASYRVVTDGTLTMDYASIFCKYSVGESTWNKGVSSADTSYPHDIEVLFDVTGPTPATNLVVENITGTTADLSWEASSDPDASGYFIYYRNASMGSFQQYASTTTTWIHLAGLSSETDYSAYVRAIDSSQNPSNISNIASFTTLDITSPEPPLNLSFSQLTGTSINLSWLPSSSSDIKLYRIFMNASVPGTFNIVASLNVSFAWTVINHLVSEVEYTFYMDTIDTAIVPNNSTRSNYLVVTTRDITPPDTPNLGSGLPGVTNAHSILIKGQVPGEGGISIVILNSVVGYFNATADAAGMFSATVDLAEGTNVLSISAVDAAGNPSAVLTYTIIRETVPPLAVAGTGISAFVGDLITFNGSGSSDDLGIATYTWSFVYNGTTVSFYSMSFSYTFDIQKNYYVTLNVTDPAGNYAVDHLWVNITVLDTTPPVLVSRVPRGYGVDRNITSIVVTFNELINMSSINMNVNSDSGDVVSGTVGYSTSTGALTYTLAEHLVQNTSYIVDISVSDLAGNLATFNWTFKTAADPYIDNNSDGGVVPLDGGQGTDGSNDNSLTTWIFISVAAVILVGVIIATFYFYKRSATSEKFGEATRAEDYEEEGEGHLFKCPECGAELAEGITYCYECGAEIDVDDDEVEDDGEDEVEDDGEDEVEDDGEDEVEDDGEDEVEDDGEDEVEDDGEDEVEDDGEDEVEDDGEDEVEDDGEDEVEDDGEGN